MIKLPKSTAFIKRPKKHTIFTIQFHSQDASSKIYWGRMRGDLNKIFNKILDKLVPDKAIHFSVAKFFASDEELAILRTQHADKTEEINLNVKDEEK